MVVWKRINIWALMLIIVQMLMFPEGTTTSGRALIKFKPGESSAWEWPGSHNVFGMTSVRFKGCDWLSFPAFRRLSRRGPGPACCAAVPQWAGEWSQNLLGTQCDLRPNVFSGGMTYNHAFVDKCRCSCHILFVILLLFTIASLPRPITWDS